MSEPERWNPFDWIRKSDYDRVVEEQDQLKERAEWLRSDKRLLRDRAEAVEREVADQVKLRDSAIDEGVKWRHRAQAAEREVERLRDEFKVHATEMARERDSYRIEAGRLREALREIVEDFDAHRYHKAIERLRAALTEPEEGNWGYVCYRQGTGDAGCHPEPEDGKDG